MKVYIRSFENGIPHNYNFMNAWQGFREMGFELIPFSDVNQLKQSEKNDIVVGYVDEVRSRLKDFNIVSPEMDYPEELSKYFGRKIWTATMYDVSNNPDCWPVFFKPVEDKQFTGVIVRSTKDLIGCGIAGVNQDVYCSEIVDFVAEWRCFIRYGKILSVRPYKGDWRIHYDSNVIEKRSNRFHKRPFRICD